jgi:IS30 family transposase
LVLEERVRIEVLWSQGLTIPKIAELVGRDRTTVWREIKRNTTTRYGPKHPHGRSLTRPDGWGGLYRWGYDATQADRKARRRARRPRVAVCAPGGPLRQLVLDKLRQRWSPREIEQRLRLEFPDRPELQVSHETIYQAIYVQSRGGLRAELSRQVALRSGRTRRRAAPQPAGALRSRRSWAQGLNISARPAEAADRAVPGHWEGDLIIGARGSSAIVTLVERSTRYVLLGELPDSRVSEQVVTVLSTLIGRLPEHLRRSLTWDLGNEMAQHAQFSVATGCPVYFCDPHSPWQRGSNENTNGLLRQYFPKHTFDFRTIDQAHLDQVAAELNGRPRQTLGWYKPAEKLNELLVATSG